MITVSAKNYDEAITKALIELQISSDHLKVEVVQEGTPGFLGLIGGKPWIIKADIKDENDPDQEKPAKKAPSKKENKKEVSKAEKDVKKEPRREVPKEKRPEVKENREVKEIRKHTPLDRPEEKLLTNNKEDKTKKEAAPQLRNRKSLTEEEAGLLIEKSNQFLKDVLKTMDINVIPDSKFDYENNEISVLLKSEEDMGILIGKRGQTLDSLQYILSLVINKNTESYIRVKLDTENYRQRRKDKLEILAKNIASKVKRSKKPISLEPMNPYERRIIHSVLQNDHQVSTISEGEDPNRYITVVLRNNKGKRNSFHSKSGRQSSKFSGKAHDREKTEKNTETE